MNYLYEVNDAKLWLESYTQQCLQDPMTSNNRYINLLDVNDCRVVEYSEPPCLRLTKEVEGEIEEVTVRVPGILCSKTLPPVLGLRSNKPEHVRYVRQFARCCGFGSHSFDEHAGIFKQVYAAFAAAPNLAELDDFDFGLYEGHHHISRLHPDIDPNHALEIARDTKFIRVEENVVQYSKRVTQDDGSYHYEPLHPEEFKEGDVVEAVGSFVAFPTGTAGEYCMVFCLRGLTMLTNTFREKSRLARNTKIERTETREGRRKKRVKPPTTQALKRSFIQYGRRVEGGRRAESGTVGGDPTKAGDDSRMVV
ncbi:hypothetical protein DFP72DRAFT_1080472 [Ephemerocybe angulata]|uniref:Uncharacterized protein n=1 Tax=Ephemerocybe angulata TaxID=980116 RepID=A0A8H6HA06_9AGAR|nr:hypothetical protein DFP72DRAFT_1080472 [Tulosesus angulatus]